MKWLPPISLLFLMGCTTIKKAAVVSGVTGGTAAVASALSSGAAVPILAATGGAFVASATTDVMMKEKAMQCEAAVTGFWPLLGQVIEVGGWLLGAIILVPLLMGFLIPNGLERKKKRGK